MFCYSCGEKNQDIAIFCKKCGMRIVAQDSVSVVTPKPSFGFFAKIYRIFAGIVEFTAQIVISTIISLAVLFGLFWAWTKYVSHY